MPTHVYAGTASLSSATVCFIAESTFGAAAMAELIAVARPLRSVSVIVCRGASPRRTSSNASAFARTAHSQSFFQLPVHQGQTSKKGDKLQRCRQSVQAAE